MASPRGYQATIIVIDSDDEQAVEPTLSDDADGNDALLCLLNALDEDDSFIDIDDQCADADEEATDGSGSGMRNLMQLSSSNEEEEGWWNLSASLAALSAQHRTVATRIRSRWNLISIATVLRSRKALVSLPHRFVEQDKPRCDPGLFRSVHRTLRATFRLSSHFPDRT